MDRRCKWCGGYMGKQSIGGALLRSGTGFGEYCGAQCKAAAEAAAGQSTSTEAAEKKEGLAVLNAINFEGDAKSIVSALGSIQTMASAHGGFSSGDDANALRKAAWQKMELGIRMLRSAGDSENASYFENQLKNMRFKAKLPYFLYAGIFIVLAISLAIYFANN